MVPYVPFVKDMVFQEGLIDISTIRLCYPGVKNAYMWDNRNGSINRYLVRQERHDS